MTPRLLAQYVQVVEKLADRGSAGARKLITALARIDDPVEREAMLAAALPGLVDPLEAAASTVATEFYEAQAGGAATFRAEVLPARDWDEIAPRTAGWVLAQADPVAALVASVARSVRNAGRDTVIVNAGREGARWYRQASPGACGFCRMLATRPPVYSSEAAALRVVGRGGKARGERDLGGKFHDNCSCTAVVVRPGESWSPDPAMKVSQDDYAAARDAGLSDPGEIAAHMDKSARVRAKAALPDPKRDVDYSLAGLSEAEIRRRTAGVRLPRIDPAAPPRGLAIYGDTTLDLSNAIEHSAYGLTTQKGPRSKRKRQPKQGGHIWGMPAENKTWFHEDQSPQHIADILSQVLDKPDYYTPVVEGGNDRRRLIKEIDGVQYQAMWFQNQNGDMVFSSVFPTGGRGIYRYNGHPDTLTPTPLLTAEDLARENFIRVE